jgi:hypothetical protein
MKKLLLFTILIILFSCGPSRSYTARTVKQFNEMKPPVILLCKTKNDYVINKYGVSLIDGDGKVYTFGNMSLLANGIGNDYCVGDTIRYKVISELN